MVRPRVRASLPGPVPGCALIRKADPILAGRGQGRPLHRLTVEAFAGIPGYMDQFDRAIPDDFWVKSGVDEAEVSCPCGETPCLELGAPHVCACERAFVYLGRSVRVAFSPAPS